MKSKLVAIILLFSICFTGLAGCDSGGGSSARIETAVATEVPATMEAVEIPDPDAYRPPDIYTENEFASEWLNLRYTPPADMHCDVEADNFYNSMGKTGRYEMDFYDSSSNKAKGVTIITKPLDGSSLEEECERIKQDIPSGEVYGFYIKNTWEPDRDFTFLGETYRLLTHNTETYLNSALQRQGTEWILLRVKGDRLITIHCCAYPSTVTLDDLLAPFSTYYGTETYVPAAQ